MDILLQLPVIVWGVFAFIVGTGVGSFLNVLVARLPYEKSIIWPGSRCGSCLRPLRKFDNLPIVGYLRLRGKCRFCGERFSIVYMLFEVGVGLVFLSLFLLDVVWNWHTMPGLRDSQRMLTFGVPGWEAVAVLIVHATLASLLIAAAGIDATHRIIPPQITYVGVVLGLIASTLFPWPWPSMDLLTLNQLPHGIEWALPTGKATIPIGVMPWPFWEPPSWAPAWKLATWLAQRPRRCNVRHRIGQNVQGVVRDRFRAGSVGPRRCRLDDDGRGVSRLANRAVGVLRRGYRLLVFEAADVSHRQTAWRQRHQRVALWPRFSIRCRPRLACMAVDRRTGSDAVRFADVDRGQRGDGRRIAVRGLAFEALKHVEDRDRRLWLSQFA